MANIIGDNTNNNLIGTIDDDLIQGLDGDDVLEGRAGNDVLEGGNGNDTLMGQEGEDRLNGGAGDDVLNPGIDFNNTVDGGTGVDTLTIDYTSFAHSYGVYNNASAFFLQYTDSRLAIYRNIEQFNIVGSVFDDNFLVRANDSFNAGAGNDILRLNLGSATTDVLVDLTQANNQVVFQNTQVSNFERASSITTGSGNDSITLSDMVSGATITAGGGNDSITLSATASLINGVINGGAGTDTLTLDYTNAGDRIYNNTAGIFYWWGSNILYFNNIERLNLKGSIYDDDLTVRVNDTVDAGAGSDILRLNMSGAAAAVTVNLSQATDQVTLGTTQVSNFERAGTIATGSGNDTITIADMVSYGSLSSGSGNDSITLAEGASVSNSSIDGGAGTDTLALDYTNLGNAIYNGTYGISYWWGSRLLNYNNIERFNLKGTAFDDDFTVRTGDTFDAAGGSDVLRLNLAGSTTAVTVNLTQATNQVNFGTTQVSNFERAGSITTGSGNDTLTFNQMISGASINSGSGDDTISVSDAATTSNGFVNGGAGADVLTLNYTAYGGNGIYNTATGVYEYWSNTTLLSYSNVENFNIIGSAVDDVLTVRSNDVFNGAGGSDVLQLDLADATSAVTVNLSQATNQVTYLNTQVTNFERIGSIATGTGNDSITLGRSGSTSGGTVDAGAGADTLVLDYSTYGGNGVYNTTAGVYEYWWNTTLLSYSNVETLNITGSAVSDSLLGFANNDILNGGSGDDTLTGDAGDDRLDGGLGNDTMLGGAGNDTYIVNSASDVVTEDAAAGIDLVQSSIVYTLGTNVENLTLTGTGNINGTGNGLDNTLTGNSGNNVLNGGAGSDTMIGGNGNDTYVVDNVGDVVTELPGGGVDLVQASVTYTLSAEVESLTLTGTTAINGTGNSLPNTLTGNTGSNTLSGAEGNDILNGGNGSDALIGGSGSDSLTGGTGADQFTFNSGVTFNGPDFGVDTIIDFNSTQVDKIALGRTTFGLTSVVGTGFSVAGEFAVVTSDTNAATSSALIVYNSSTGSLFYNQNGSAAGFGSGQQLATIAGTPALIASDFVIQA